MPAEVAAGPGSNVPVSGCAGHDPPTRHELDRHRSDAVAAAGPPPGKLETSGRFEVGRIGDLALARFDRPSVRATHVELSLQLGPVQPPAEVVGELLRAAAALAAEAGADRLVVDFDPRCQFVCDVLAASGLDWHVRSAADAATAEVPLGEPQTATAPQEAAAGSVSVVRTHPKGVTVLPTAEGPSLRSDPRWTARRARRSTQLLERLVTRRGSRQAKQQRVGRQTDTITGRRLGVGHPEITVSAEPRP